jgi:hypothetical protein
MLHQEETMSESTAQQGKHKNVAILAGASIVFGFLGYWYAGHSLYYYVGRDMGGLEYNHFSNFLGYPALYSLKVLPESFFAPVWSVLGCVFGFALSWTVIVMGRRRKARSNAGIGIAGKARQRLSVRGIKELK